MATIEVTAVFGTVIISDNLIARNTSLRKSSGSFPNLDRGLREQCRIHFEEGLRLLDLLAQRSSLALKEARIIRQLQLRIVHEGRMVEQITFSTIGLDPSQCLASLEQDHPSSNMAEYQQYFSSNEIPNRTQEQDFLTAEWESISMAADMS